MSYLKNIFPVLLITMLAVATSAQEHTGPLYENPDLRIPNINRDHTAARPSSLSLPFFEDFTDNDVYPSSSRWADKQIFVNNNMAVAAISRGVATFDALDQFGVPYDTLIPYHQVYADSLTSLPVDLSGHVAADSIYLSFFYEPKGYGFAPKTTDSLILYMHSSTGSWNKVWSTAGDTAVAFKQVMIAITAPEYFYEDFNFRFVNKATMGISDSHWNLDYIRMDEGRNIHDTLVNDIAFTTQPYSILNDFTAMPYWHFNTAPSSFLATQHAAFIRNNGNTGTTEDYGYSAREITTGTAFGTDNGTVFIPPATEDTVTFPMYSTSGFSPSNPKGRFVFENKYSCAPAYAGESLANDTITFHQVFDNYFAYDDGTAEQSYFLNLAPSAPGKIAIEYALYNPDTIRGVAIRFVRQVPSAAGKDFSLAIYKAINPGVGADEIVYQQDFYYPSYEDTVNKLSVFRFDEPVAMDAGIFYVGVIQPAGGISDSLKIALDKNRIGGNHRYFNVGAVWQPSLIDGALMVRPLIGGELPSSINNPLQSIAWELYPNPASNDLHIRIDDSYMQDCSYQVTDLSGRVMQKDRLGNNKSINTGNLTPGMYILQIVNNKGRLRPAKFLKL